MLMAPDGRRLSKRDKDLDMGAIRTRMTPEQLIGILACAAGITGDPCPISARELAGTFRWDKVKSGDIVPHFLTDIF